MGAIYAGATDPQYDALSCYGEHVGLAFQIVDDILDVEHADMSLAREWRAATRWAFMAALEAGFFVSEYCRSIRGQQGPGAYLLEKGSLGEFVAQPA